MGIEELRLPPISAMSSLPCQTCADALINVHWVTMGILPTHLRHSCDGSEMASIFVACDVIPPKNALQKLKYEQLRCAACLCSVRTAWTIWISDVHISPPSWNCSMRHNHLFQFQSQGTQNTTPVIQGWWVVERITDVSRNMSVYLPNVERK